MPYREIHIGRETFVTRVSDEAVNEWLEVRERNRNIGYPDRPPDIDNEFVREWIIHPDELNYQQKVLKDNLPQTSFIVYTLSFEIRITELLLEHKVLVSYVSDKDSYMVRVLARTADGEPIFDREVLVTDEEVSDFLDEVLETASELITPYTKPFITTYVDFQAMEEERDLAQKELDDYYGKPMVH